MARGKIYHEHDFDFNNPLHQYLDGLFCQGLIAGWKFSKDTKTLFITFMGTSSTDAMFDIGNELSDYGFDTKHCDVNVVINRQTGEFYQQLEVRQKDEQ